jgi:predicted transcriptional regulator of viral defense system
VHPDSDGLLERARSQGGAFTVGQAREHGYSPAAVRHRVRAGRWTRLRRGVLTDGDRWDALTSSAQLLCQTWAAVLALGPGAVVSHDTAALLHRMATYGPTPPHVTMTRPSGSTTPDGFGGLVVQRAALTAKDVTRLIRLPVTTMERTAVDLARAGPICAGVVAMDSALRLGARAGVLEATARRQTGWPGVRRARQALTLIDAGSESPLESLAHVCQHQCGIDRPLTQVCVYDDAAFIGRVDDFWPQHATVGETDGLAKYADPSILRAEKLRQERLERTGLQVVRVVARDVTVDVVRTGARYREAFARGREALARGATRFTWQAAVREPSQAPVSDNSRGEGTWGSRT